MDEPQPASKVLSGCRILDRSKALPSVSQFDLNAVKRKLSLFAVGGEKFLWPKESLFNSTLSIKNRNLEWTELLNQIKETKKYSSNMCTNENSPKICRDYNKALQFETRIWCALLEAKGLLKSIEEVLPSSDTESVSESLSSIRTLERCDRELGLCSKWGDEPKTPELLQLKDLKDRYAILENDLLSKLSRTDPGPVGNLPLHDCLLLGLTDLFKKVVTRRPDLVNLPYKNDLDPWRNPSETTRHDDDDADGEEDGLYTGETALHIAIVQKDLHLVGFLLENGASLSARARGVFFQPRRIRLRVIFPSNPRPMEVGKTIQNDESGAYFGEYPLSFAASVGSIEACKRILETWNFRAAAASATSATDAPAAVGRPPPRRWKHCAFVTRAAAEDAASDARSALFNAADTFGNTALHMAVMHGQRAAVDWLVQSGGGGGVGVGDGKTINRDRGKAAALHMLNNDGLTPLILAARLGDVGMFRHILYTHMSEIVWVLGQVLPTSIYPRMHNLALYLAHTRAPQTHEHAGTPLSSLRLRFEDECHVSRRILRCATRTCRRHSHARIVRKAGSPARAVSAGKKRLRAGEMRARARGGGGGGRGGAAGADAANGFVTGAGFVYSAFVLPSCSPRFFLLQKIVLTRYRSNYRHCDMPGRAWLCNGTRAYHTAARLANHMKKKITSIRAGAIRWHGHTQGSVRVSGRSTHTRRLATGRREWLTAKSGWGRSRLPSATRCRAAPRSRGHVARARSNAHSACQGRMANSCSLELRACAAAGMVVVVVNITA